MSPRALVRALVALGVLVALWAGVALVRGGLSESTGELRLPVISPGEVDGITISGPSDTVLLARGADGWAVNGAAADPAEVRKLMEALADSVLTGELVARSPGSHARMGVDSTGRRVVVRAGDEVLVDLVLGNQGTGFASAYARLAGADEVHLVRGPLGGLVARDASAWRSRRVAAIAGDSVGRIVLRRAGAEWAVVREGDTWVVDGRPADTAAVRRLLAALSDITAIGFATPAEVDSLDFERPDRRLTVLSRRADTLLDLLVDSTAAGFRVRRSSADDVFQVDFWRVNELIPSLESLRPPGP